MNRTDLNKIEMKARRIAENSFDIIGTEDKKGNMVGYGINLDGHIYWSLEEMYERYPELRTRRRKTSK